MLFTFSSPRNWADRKKKRQSRPPSGNQKERSQEGKKDKINLQNKNKKKKKPNKKKNQQPQTHKPLPPSHKKRKKKQKRPGCLEGGTPSLSILFHRRCIQSQGVSKDRRSSTSPTRAPIQNIKRADKAKRPLSKIKHTLSRLPGRPQCPGNSGRGILK